jgi:hypothetical protein
MMIWNQEFKLSIELKFQVKFEFRTGTVALIKGFRVTLPSVTVSVASPSVRLPSASVTLSVTFPIFSDSVVGGGGGGGGVVVPQDRSASWTWGSPGAPDATYEYNIDHKLDAILFDTFVKLGFK